MSALDRYRSFREQLEALGYDTSHEPTNLRHYPSVPAADPPKRANCCDERPGVRTTFVCGIETNVCGPCGGDDDEPREAEEFFQAEQCPSDRYFGR